MTATRPYVDRGVLDLDAASLVARSMAAEWGLGTPSLLRQGMNAIYACADVVLRVGRASAPAAASHERVTALLDRGVATVPPVAGLATDRDGFAVSAWVRVEPVDTPVDWEAVGANVAVVHGLDRATLPPAYPMPSPSMFPWWDFDTMLADVADHIDERPLAGLRRAVADGGWWSEAVDAATIVCHGDVHPGNVLMHADGPLLIDWDLMCLAAPAWDHAMLITYHERWGGAPGVYEAFASGYGRSLADDDLTVTIAELRNVAATLMRVKFGLHDPAAQAEGRSRLRYWAGDPDAPVWQAQ